MLREGFELLKKYDIPIPKYWVNELPKNPEFPLVIKADVGHKTEKGAVILDINDYEELLFAYKNLEEKFPNTDIIVQKQLTGKWIEVIIGIKRDVTFNYIVLFGIGGIYAEILRDFIILVPPFDKNDFIKLLNELRLKQILLGYRNLPKANIEKIFNVIKKLEKMFTDINKFEEFEINPLMVNENRLYAVDVRFTYRK